MYQDILQYCPSSNPQVLAISNCPNCVELVAINEIKSNMINVVINGFIIFCMFLLFIKSYDSLELLCNTLQLILIQSKICQVL